MEFKFYQDIKVSVWQRQTFVVDAETEEDAIKIAKEFRDKDASLNLYGIYPFDFETLSDTEEIIKVEENHGFPTIEILNEDGKQIANNLDYEEE